MNIKFIPALILTTTLHLASSNISLSAISFSFMVVLSFFAIYELFILTFRFNEFKLTNEYIKRLKVGELKYEIYTFNGYHTHSKVIDGLSVVMCGELDPTTLSASYKVIKFPDVSKSINKKWVCENVHHWIQCQARSDNQT